MEQQTPSPAEFDRPFREQYGCIIGVDEAGRGPLAGPVTAAAVSFAQNTDHPLIRDSKKLSEKQRETAYAWIIEHAEKWSVHSLGVQAINRMNILQAALSAMQRAVEKFGQAPGLVLIDGTQVPEAIRDRSKAVVDGDSRSFSIAAASILAKVSRDRMMRRWGEIFPEYGFEQHKGYGTAAHLKAIAEHYPCPLHRRDFAPIKHWQLSERPDRHILGKWGENWAIYYLILKGYHYVTRNYHGGNSGEIDIVMRRDDETYAMIEVKTVFYDNEALAAERIDESKIRKMMDAAEHYFYHLNIPEYFVKFEAVTVSGKDWFAPHIEHYQDIL
ncbi:MAG: ribonuclease HII [Candidatus Neomarinimicrobiota bacterium]|jgi:ribonuclease HII|nr:ribonuclease HII [Candidatus Neomarinimicrobiota bacterium]MDX9779471.1 ribonuclease HII [bacterium]